MNGSKVRKTRKHVRFPHRFFVRFFLVFTLSHTAVDGIFKERSDELKIEIILLKKNIIQKFIQLDFTSLKQICVEKSLTFYDTKEPQICLSKNKKNF